MEPIAGLGAQALERVAYLLAAESDGYPWYGYLFAIVLFGLFGFWLYAVSARNREDTTATVCRHCGHDSGQTVREAPRCPACGKKRWHTGYFTRSWGATPTDNVGMPCQTPLRTVRCDGCGYTFSRPRLPKDCPSCGGSKLVRI
jgi:predicted Zn-ribbon and HTH transcriptional regulator